MSAIDFEARLVARATSVPFDADAMLLVERLDEITEALDRAAKLATEYGLSGLAMAIESDRLAAQRIRLRLMNRRKAAR